MSFNFNPKIDRDFIISMYEEDYPYISEMFSTTLNQLIPDVEMMKQHFKNGDLVSVRKQVHKVKPAFGFAGLRQAEAVCQEFEDSCMSAPSTASLHEQYAVLTSIMDESCELIQQEIERLKVYNN
jgi:HPt (histidine-containing phosphotransfer) domain-containing protein